MSAIDALHDEKQTRRLRYELDHRIKTINREKIGAATGDINKQTFIQTAELVADLRARYLKNVLFLATACHDKGVDPATVLKLKDLREAYQEALQGFDALEHALDRGYIDLRS